MSWDAIIADIAEVSTTIVAVIAIYSSVRGFINKGIRNEQRQNASMSRSRPLFSGLAVLLILAAAVVWVLHLVGIVVGEWSNPLVIVMITAGAVLVILQWAFPLGSSREDVAYKSWLKDFKGQLDLSKTRAIVIRGSKKMLRHEVYIWVDDGPFNPTENPTINKSAIFDEYSTSEDIPIILAVFEELKPKIYSVVLSANVKSYRKRQSYKGYQEFSKVWKKRVDVQPKRVGEVDWRKEKPDYVPTATVHLLRWRQDNDY